MTAIHGKHIVAHRARLMSTLDSMVRSTFQPIGPEYVVLPTTEYLGIQVFARMIMSRTRQWVAL